VSDRNPSDVWTTAPVPTATEIMDIGAHLERERIIKLLEEDADNNYYALQLLKGEQK
jgi:hypothetical protein